MPPPPGPGPGRRKAAWPWKGMTKHSSLVAKRQREMVDCGIYCYHCIVAEPGSCCCVVGPGRRTSVRPRDKHHRSLRRHRSSLMGDASVLHTQRTLRSHEPHRPRPSLMDSPLLPSSSSTRGSCGPISPLHRVSRDLRRQLLYDGLGFIHRNLRADRYHIITIDDRELGPIAVSLNASQQFLNILNQFGFDAGEATFDPTPCTSPS